MSNDRLSSEEIAFMNMFRSAGPTAEELAIQAGISATMADVIRHDARHNPNALSPPVTVRPIGAEPVVTAGSGNGWADEVPLRLPPGQDVIERMVNVELPHGPKHGRKR
jgi:hypothetical protein